MLSDEEPGKATPEPVQLPLFHATKRTVPKSKREHGRAFGLACQTLKHLVGNKLTIVELAVASGTSYDTCQRIIAAGRSVGLIVPDGVGASPRGLKPTKYTIK